jgi:hypothetical protein
MAIADLVTCWVARADALAQYAAPEVCRAFRQAATELEIELREAHGEAVTLKEASLAGGYSIDHLQRLVASGQLENVGRKNRPRIRRADVPTKPGHGLRDAAEADQFSTRRRIVASVATGSEEHS